MTISIRLIRAGDAGWLDTWTPTLISKLDLEAADFSGLLSDDRTTAWICEEDRHPAGLAVARHVPHKELAQLLLIATPPQSARRGIGMQTAVRIEHALSRRGVRTIVAPALEQHGIAVYFWIRLGYRPLLNHQWPCRRPGMIWLRHDLPQKKGSQSRMLLKTPTPK